MAARCVDYMTPAWMPNASELIEPSLKDAEESGDCDALAFALFAAGNVRNWKGDETGVELLRRAGAMVDQLDNPRVALKALHNLSVFQGQIGDLTGAVTNAVTLAREAARYGWTEGVADAFTDLGEIYMQVGRADLAIDYNRRAFELLESIGNHAWAAAMLLNEAEAELRLGHAERTIAIYERIASMNQMRPADQPLMLLYHARALAQVGRLREAEQKLNEAFQSSSYYANSSLLPQAAEVRLAEGRYEDALRLVAVDKVKFDFEDTLWRAYTVRSPPPWVQVSVMELYAAFTGLCARDPYWWT